MTIEKARKILQVDENKLSDKEVESIIEETFRLSRFFIDRFLKGEITIQEMEQEVEDVIKEQKSLKLFTEIGYNSDEDRSKIKSNKWK